MQNAYVCSLTRGYWLLPLSAVPQRRLYRGPNHNETCAVYIVSLAILARPRSSQLVAALYPLSCYTALYPASSQGSFALLIIVGFV
jgi:hypothetical protein